MNLSEPILKKIEEVIPRYPTKRSAVLPILHLVQEDQGYISEEATEWIAAKLEIEPIHVWELLAFYPMIRQKPVGRNLIRVCRTLPCALAGSYKTCDAFKKALGCELNEVSPGGESMVEFAECLASCGTGPVVMVNDDFYEKVDAEKAAEIVAKIKEKEKKNG
ncbi:MAG: NAD(P)H-dependent oxidoreductase subunit E [Opitutales bacterium]